MKANRLCLQRISVLFNPFWPKPQMKSFFIYVFGVLLKGRRAEMGQMEQVIVRSEYFRSQFNHFNKGEMKLIHCDTFQALLVN